MKSEVEQAAERLSAIMEKSIKDHDAIDFVAGNEFVAWIKKNNGLYEAEVSSWGVKHGVTDTDQDKDVLIGRLFDTWD